MALLANLSAYDFGYSSAAQLLDRTEKTLATLSRMERFRGHFYNWYDTRTLKPLPPRYVSTVDSGNLVGHLLVLRRGLLGLTNESIISPRFRGGIGDTLRVLLDLAQAQKLGGEIIRKLEIIQLELQQAPQTLSALHGVLQ